MSPAAPRIDPVLGVYFVIILKVVSAVGTRTHDPLTQNFNPYRR